MTVVPVLRDFRHYRFRTTALYLRGRSGLDIPILAVRFIPVTPHRQGNPMKTHSKPILALVLLSLVVAAFVTLSSRPAQAARAWDVAPPPIGSDSNECLAPSTPCATN